MFADAGILYVLSKDNVSLVILACFAQVYGALEETGHTAVLLFLLKVSDDEVGGRR